MGRIGIYGGTFNPPHMGHVQGAAFAVQALGLDRILVMPNREAPHKSLPKGSPTPEERLEMVRIAFSSVERAEVSDLELKRQGRSYTADTVAELKKQYPGDELFLLMGTDMFLSFLTWYHPERILENATLAVMCRGDRDEEARILAQEKVIGDMGYRVCLLHNPVVDISSTDLRRMLLFVCADSFLPAGLGGWIREKGFYETGSDCKNLPMENLEPLVIRLLNPNRVNHVLGCRDTAVTLAERYGANVRDAARAGILHDITKALDGPLQLTLCAEYGIILDHFSQHYPKTLHALTGSLVAERIFGENAAVVQAIRNHTTGAPDMNLLDKIIYVADYMEPNRDFPGVERLRELAFRDLDEALYLGLSMTLDHLADQGAELSPETAQTMQWLEARGTAKA